MLKELIKESLQPGEWELLEKMDLMMSADDIVKDMVEKNLILFQRDKEDD